MREDQSQSGFERAIYRLNELLLTDAHESLFQSLIDQESWILGLLGLREQVSQPAIDCVGVVADRTRLIPDVLATRAGRDCIVDLKRGDSAKLGLVGKPGRKKVSAELAEYVSQVQTYAEIFGSELGRDRVSTAIGRAVSAYPECLLIGGRAPAGRDPELSSILGRWAIPSSLVTWDEVLSIMLEEHQARFEPDPDVRAATLVMVVRVADGQHGVIFDHCVEGANRRLTLWVRKDGTLKARLRDDAGVDLLCSAHSAGLHDGEFHGVSMSVTTSLSESRLMVHVDAVLVAQASISSELSLWNAIGRDAGWTLGDSVQQNGDGVALDLTDIAFFDRLLTFVERDEVAHYLLNEKDYTGPSETRVSELSHGHQRIDDPVIGRTYVRIPQDGFVAGPAEQDMLSSLAFRGPSISNGAQRSLAPAELSTVRGSQLVPPTGSRMCVVLDTSVLLTAAFDLMSVPSLLLHERDRLDLVMPAAGWHEARNVARRAALRTGVSVSTANQVLDLFGQVAGIRIVESGSLVGTTADGFDAHFEAVASHERADAICTYNGNDFSEASTSALSPLALLRRLDFPKYSMAVPTLDQPDGCFFIDFLWHSTAGFENAWLLSDSEGRSFGIDSDGNWVWSDGAMVEQREGLRPGVAIELLVGWRPDGLVVWSAKGGSGFVEMARSKSTLSSPAKVEFLFSGPGNGWNIELHSTSGAAAFPSKGRRKTIHREGGVDSTFASLDAAQLVRGTFVVAGPEDRFVLKIDGDGNRRPLFGHRPSSEPDAALQGFMWTDLLPGLEQVDLVNHASGERHVRWNGNWTQLLGDNR